jgi:hypothetical protein
LKSGSLEREESVGDGERAVFKGICALALRSNVPLQVFSRETTPILGIESPIVTEGLPRDFEYGGDGRDNDVQNQLQQHMTADEVLREKMGGSGRYVRSQSIHARVNAE